MEINDQLRKDYIYYCLASKYNDEERIDKLEDEFDRLVADY